MADAVSAAMQTGPECLPPLMAESSNFARAYTAVKKVQEQVPDLQKTMTVPKLVITGVQSSGKTTFIEALMGSPAGFTAHGTATRCPVRYIRRRVKNDSEKRFRVYPATREHEALELTDQREVSPAVQRHMEKLKELGKEGGFSSEPLCVEIFMPHGNDLDITDLPGMMNEIQPEHEIIKGIVAKTLSDDTVIPVVMLRAESSSQTSFASDVLKKAGLELKRSIVVCNFFNMELPNHAKISEVKQWCEGYIRDFQEAQEVFFVMPMYKYPTPQAKKDLTFEQHEKYLTSLHETEQDEMKRLLQEKTQDTTLGEDIERRLGLKPVVKKLLDILDKAVRKEGKDWAGVLSSKKQEYEGQLQLSQQSLREYTDGNILSEAHKYVALYVDIVNGSRTAEASFAISPLAGDKSLDPPEEVCKAQPCRTTWEMEIQGMIQDSQDQNSPALATPYRDGGMGKSSEELQEELGQDSLGDSLVRHLGPDAAYDRALKITKYLLIKYPYTEQTMDEIMTIRGRGRNQAVEGCPKEFIFRTILKNQLLPLRTLVKGLAEHILWIYTTQPCSVAHSTLKKFFPVLAQLEPFTKKLDKIYWDLLWEQVKEACEFMYKQFKYSTEFLQVDLPVVLLSLLASTPFRDDMLKSKPRPYVEEMKDPEQKKVAGAGEEDQEEQEERVRSRSTGREYHREAPGVEQHRELVLKVKRLLHGIQPEFRDIWFVEGGLQAVHAEDPRSTNEDEINRDCKVYWHLIKGQLSMELSKAFDAEVLWPLEHKVPDKLKKKLTDYIHNELSEEKILDMMDREGGMEEKRKERDELHRQLAAISAALEELKTVLGGKLPTPARSSKAPPVKALKFEDPEVLEGVVLPLGDMDIGDLDPSWTDIFKDMLRKDIVKELEDETVRPRDVKILMRQGEKVRYVVEGGHRLQKEPRLERARDFYLDHVSGCHKTPKPQSAPLTCQSKRDPSPSPAEGASASSHSEPAAPLQQHGEVPGLSALETEL